MGKLFVGDVGTKIVVDAGVSLEGHTLIKFLVSKNNGSPVDWSAVVEDATGGIVVHYVGEGDLNVAGKYKLALYVEFGSDKYTGETAVFMVYDRYGDVRR